MTGKNGRCIFSRNAFFDKSKAIELNIEILIDYGCCATIAGTKRRTLIAIVVLMVSIRIAVHFCFGCMVFIQTVNTGNGNERYEIYGQYVANKPHHLTFQVQK